MGEGVGGIGAKARWLNGCVVSGRGVLLVAAAMSDKHIYTCLNDDKASGCNMFYCPSPRMEDYLRL